MDWCILIGTDPRLRLRPRLAPGQARHARDAVVEVAAVAVAVEVGVVEVAMEAVVGRKLETRSIFPLAFKSLEQRISCSTVAGDRCRSTVSSVPWILMLGLLALGRTTTTVTF